MLAFKETPKEFTCQRGLPTFLSLERGKWETSLYRCQCSCIKARDLILMESPSVVPLQEGLLNNLFPGGQSKHFLKSSEHHRPNVK